MAEKPTQKTQPRGKNDDGTPAEPIDIPIPTRGQILGDLARSAQAAAPKKRRRRK